MEQVKTGDVAKQAGDMAHQLVLGQYASHPTFEEALKSIPEAERIAFLRRFHDPIKLDCEEEISSRLEEAKSMLDESLQKSNKPPYEEGVIETLLTVCRCQVLPELFPRMDEVNKNLREKLANLDIDNPQAAMQFGLGITKLSMEYNQLLRAEIESECKSYGLDQKVVLEQSAPIVATDLSFYSDLTHLYSLKCKEKFPKDSVDIDSVTKYVSTSNDFSKKFLSKPMNPQIAMAYPNMVEVFMFNKTKIEFIQVECFVADFLEKYPKEPSEKEKTLLRLLMEEAYLCQKVQERILEANQQHMDMMGQLMGEGMPGMGQLSESQMEELQNLFDPKNAEMLKAMMGNFDMEKLQEMMPFMEEMMGQMGGPGGMPPEMFGPGGLPPNPFGMGGPGGAPPNPFGMGGQPGFPPNPFGMGGASQPGGPHDPFNMGGFPPGKPPQDKKPKGK